jgi:ribA/ribD-fused uncharacterized protein
MAAAARLRVLGATCPACEGVGRKFPRSSHLANLGAATHDDLLLDAEARALFVGGTAGVVTLEEKMDGGNIGISLDEHGRHVFQKRAHFVSSASETQYAQLEAWADQHAEELWELLCGLYPWQQQEHRRQPVAAGQRILFGEWCAYQHTVPYDNLPDLFLAFDLYDQSFNDGAGGFLSAKRRNELLATTSIRHVRCVARRKFDSVVDMVNVLEGTLSPYASSPTQIEGVYMRCDDEATGTLLARGKLVHPEFLQHIEEDGRWERNAKKNDVRLDWWWDRDNEGNVRQHLEPDQQLQDVHLADSVKRCKVLYAQASQTTVRKATPAALTELEEAADTVLAAAGGQQPFAFMCKGWLAIERQQPREGENFLEQGLELLLAAGKTGKTVAEMKRLLALCRGAATPDSGIGLVRTLSQRERDRTAAAAEATQAAEAQEKALDAELRKVAQQVGVAVAGAAGAGSSTNDGWVDPVLTPTLLTSQIWRTMRSKSNVLGFYGNSRGRPYACFSNFAEAPVAEPFEFQLPDGLIPEGADRRLFPSPMVVDFSEKAIMMCKAAAMADSESYHAIATSHTPRSAKAKGRQVYPFDEDRWQSVVCHVAREVIWQKFSQTPRLSKILLETGDRIIAEATRRDVVW